MAWSHESDVYTALVGECADKEYEVLSCVLPREKLKSGYGTDGEQ